MPRDLDPFRVLPALRNHPGQLSAACLPPTSPACADDPIVMYPGAIPLGTLRVCARCGETQIRRRTTPNSRGQYVDFWSDCACWKAAVDRAGAVSTAAVDRMRGRDCETGGAYDVATLAAQYQADPYDPTLLGDGGQLWAEALGWLRAVHAQVVVTAYRLGPPAALFFTGLRGRGKTRMAIELALEAHRLDRRVAIVNEKKHLNELRGVPFGPQYDDLIAEPAERAWLTVFDDIGKHKPVSSEDGLRVQNAWYDLIDRRYNRRRWTIFTSEHTLDDLVAQGTIDDSLYGRIYEMTRGIVVPFAGGDLRLRG